MKRNKITGQLSFDDFLKQEELNSSFDNLLLPAEQYARKNGSLHIGTTMRVFRISAIRAKYCSRADQEGRIKRKLPSPQEKK